MSSKKTALLITVALIVVIIILFGDRMFKKGGTPVSAATDPSAIDVTQDPIQDKDISEPAVFMNFKDAILKIQPAAAYRISGLVMGKRAYPGSTFGCAESETWGDRISPYDFLMVWGDVTKPENLKHIKFSQEVRWYHYLYDADSPLREDYIGKHSSNNHFIPANRNIRYAADKVKVGEPVTLEGFLVMITGTYRDGEVWWNSSLSRDDTGASSCEVFYVVRLKHGSHIYE
jgi:hypothetical protein